MEKSQTPLDKRDLFPALGIHQLFASKDKYSDRRVLTSGLAASCGSMYIGTSPNRKMAMEYKKRIYWESSPDAIVNLLPNCEEFLLIPDVDGNVVIQWSDQ